MSRILSAALFVSLAAGAAVHAQTSVGPGTPTQFKDTSFLKPPAGAKVAIVEWEDLECPACAKAFPIVHEAAKHYQIPLIRRDFPLAMHIWSHDAAIIARYLQDKVSPTVAEDYRRQVFATQTAIASKDDLHNFTMKFFQSHGQQMPFVFDPVFDKEVDADKITGDRANLNHTPTIVVVSATKWVEVLDVMQLYSVIDDVEKTAGAVPVKSTAAKTGTTAHSATHTAAHK